MRDLVARAARSCPTELAMEVVGGKWKIVVLEHLAGGTLRFGELQRALPGVTARMLTRQLRELETDGLVDRTVYAEVPPRRVPAHRARSRSAARDRAAPGVG